MKPKGLRLSEIFGPGERTVIAGMDRLTEAGAAERFARRHGDELRFDHRRARWLCWDQHRWAPDADAAVTRIALDSRAAGSTMPSPRLAIPIAAKPR